MAVETTKTSENFVGTGISSTYAPEFYVNTSDQVKVYVNDVLKTLGVDYVVNGIGASAGCTIVGAFANGSAVYIERVTPITQLVDTQNNETILEDVLDAEFDKLTMIAQELGGKADRAILVPRNEEGFVLPAASARVGKYLAFDVDGDPILASGIGTDAALRTDLADNAANLVSFRRASALGVPITSAVKVPAYLKLSAKRDLIDFIDKAYWPGMRGTTPTGVVPLNSLGQDSFAAALADMVAYPDRKLNLPAGWINQSAAWTLNDQFYDIRGEGPENTVLRTLSATADQIVLGSPFCHVEGIQMAQAVARTAGASVRVLYTGDHCVVSNIFGYNPFNLLKIDGHPTNPALDHGIYDFSNLRAYDTVATGEAFVIEGGYAITMDKLLCVAAGARCVSGVRIKNCADVRIINSQILNTVRALNAVTSAGKAIASLKMSKTYCGTSSLGSVLASSGGQVLSADFEDCWFGEADDPSGRGFAAIGTSGTFAGLKMRGCEHFLSASDGCYADTVKGLQIIGAASDGNGGSGIVVLNCPNPVVTGIRSGAARFSGNAVGLYEVGNTKGRFDGNVIGNTTNFTSASTGSVTTGLITS